MLQHPFNLVTKNSHSERDSIIVTIIELCNKNYLKFSYALNSPTMRSRELLNTLAIAIFKISDYFYFSFFTTLTTPVSVSIVHCNVSPLDTLRKSRTVAGIVVVKEPATDCIFVSYFIIIPLIYLIHYINTYIYLFTNIYNYLYYLLYRYLYILES